jgi:hypothetical protein
MEEPSSISQSTGSEPEHFGMSRNWRSPGAKLVAKDETVPRRLEWVAVILFVFNFFMLIYSYAIYSGELAWGKAIVADATATAVILLLSILFSIFGQTSLSKIAVGIGIVGLMISTVSLGIRMIQQLSEHSYYFSL